MWIATGIMSVVFCVAAWGMAAKKKEETNWASGCSLAFVAVTLLMQYRMVLDWVNKGDWSALADVVPSMFAILCGYVVLMLLANAGAIAVNKK